MTALRRLRTLRSGREISIATDRSTPKAVLEHPKLHINQQDRGKSKRGGVRIREAGVRLWTPAQPTVPPQPESLLSLGLKHKNATPQTQKWHLENLVVRPSPADGFRFSRSAASSGLAAEPGLLAEEMKTLHPQCRGNGVLVPEGVFNKRHRGVCRCFEETGPPGGGAYNSLKGNIVAAHRQSSMCICQNRKSTWCRLFSTRKRLVRLLGFEA